MKRLILILCLLPAAGCTSTSLDAWLEYDVAGLQDAMAAGELSSRELVRHYLSRIEAFDRAGPQLNSIIELNPDALAIAAALDVERRERGPRGPLHGIPVVLKANIDTADGMHTTAGSLALAGHRPPDDAFLVQRLREAGAVILGKTNLSEWANFRSTRSSSGWSSLGGQTKNPYDPARNPCGSSSGSAVAVAANLAVLAVGTETDGSIVCPAAINGIVGIKPTVGLVSRDGIIPIALSQDTAGPMARTVRDAALALRVLAAVDTSDPAAAAAPQAIADYAGSLGEAVLAGARVGVLRSYWGANEDSRVEAIFEGAVRVLLEQGAEVIDPVEIDTAGLGDAEYEVLLYEFKDGLDRYLASTGAPVASLAEVVAFNEAHAATVMPFFGQEIMEAAVEKGPLTEAGYLEALAMSRRIAREGLDAALHAHALDALIAPSNGPAWLTDHVNSDRFSIGSSSLAAVSGYPSITVPAGHVFDLPIGITFIGAPFSEARLVALAHAFEQVTRARRPPRTASR